jgi:hypothetical protein
MRAQNRNVFRQCATAVVSVLGVLAVVIGIAACARLPYATKVMHEDARVKIVAQKTLDEAPFTHPIELTSAELAGILRGFSVREQQGLPVRWFAEEYPPKTLFRSDEILLLAPYLAESFQRVGPDERVHFEIDAPGINPAARKDALAGWMAIRDPYLYLTIEYFHEQLPIHKADRYDYNYPTPPPTPKSYLLYFEPGRFWVTESKGKRAIEFREFLKSAEASTPLQRPAQ